MIAASSNPQDYHCPRCGAEPGEPCVGERWTWHGARIDRMMEARDLVGR